MKRNVRKIIPDTLLFLVVAYVGSIDFKASCLLIAGLSISALFNQKSGGHKHENEKTEKA